MGDFNNDGNLDIVVTNQDGTVSVLLGNGNGTFQAQHIYQAGMSISLAVGDVNNDGKLDIVNADVANGASVLLGNGDGTFQAQQTYSAGNDPVSIVVGDFNKDGYLDIVVTNQLNASVTVLLQQPPLAVAVDTIQAIQDVPFSGPIATISGAHMASDTTAIVNWGDGSASNGTVSGSGNTLTVSGSHTYTQGGTFTLTVTASEGTLTAQGMGQALVKTANLHARAFGVQSLNPSQSPFGDASIPSTGGNQTVTVPIAINPALDLVAAGITDTVSGSLTPTPPHADASSTIDALVGFSIVASNINATAHADLSTPNGGSRERRALPP